MPRKYKKRLSLRKRKNSLRRTNLKRKYSRKNKQLKRQRGGGLGWAPWVGSVGNTGAPIVFNRFEYVPFLKDMPNFNPYVKQ